MTRMTLLALVLLLAGGPALAVSPDRRGAAEAVARALAARKTDRQPRLHTTDFALDHVGCIVMPRAEMRRFGYPGHAFACEEVTAGEVLGAILDRRGRRICDIAGAYAGDDCYELTFCDVPERLCVH